MKHNFMLLSVCFICLSLLTAFKEKPTIPDCYLQFKKSPGLEIGTTDRLPKSSEKFRILDTEEGKIKVTRMDGYRILYTNTKQAPFVNMKVELSDPKAYHTDKTAILKNFKFLNDHSHGMTQEGFSEYEFNGYKIWGSNRASIEEGMYLGTYVMFPGNNTTVYFYFQNLKPEFRSFENIEEYKIQRDKFLEDYTSYLMGCANK